LTISLLPVVVLAVEPFLAAVALADLEQELGLQ
jgi:hypothetical protein